MGNNSIDISQYRSRIGTFAGKKLSSNGSKACFDNKLKTNTLMESFMILSCLLVLSNATQTLLIISGVELNPGPSDLGMNQFMNTYANLKHYVLQIFCHISTKTFTDRIGTKKNRECNQEITKFQTVERKQTVVSAAVMSFDNNLLPPTPRVPHPKIDATDRRVIEAKNEDKSRQTKETLDDIKRVHRKEKKKKEQNDIEPYHERIDSVC